MNGTTLDARVARFAWVQGARPRPELVDAIVKHHNLTDDSPRNWAATGLGAVVGAVLGGLLKGMNLPQAPWGPQSGLFGEVVGDIAMAGLVVSVLAAACAALGARRRPAILQFASLNLLMLLAVWLA